jgi:hypothetical protein
MPCCAGTSSDGEDQEHRDAVQALHLDGLEGDRRVRHQPTTFIENAGTSLKGALDVARKFGSVKETVLRSAARLYPARRSTFYAVAAQLKILSYFNLSLQPGGSIDAWRRWLATPGRSSRASTSTARGTTPATTRATWTLPAEPGAAATRSRSSATRPTASSSATAGERRWGDKGFGYASLAYVQDAFTEAYGISA